MCMQDSRNVLKGVMEIMYTWTMGDIIWIIELILSITKSNK